MPDGATTLRHWQEHPDRPKKPARPYPLTGDDNPDWQAWRRACDACAFHSHRYGCEEAGVVVYASGQARGLPTAPGGCKRWRPKSNG